MDKINVQIKKEDTIGIITLNRPEFNNTFNVELAEELNDALIELDNDESIHIIVINANGKNFCTGIDVKFIDGKTYEDYLAWVGLMEKMNSTIININKPVIASVHNIAVANGISLVASCDLVVAAENAKFGATAINIGLFCMGPAVPLLKTLGRKKTLELIMTGEMIDVWEAERIGLVNKIVASERLMEETLIYAKKLSDKSPLALRLGKKSFYEMEDLSFEAALELTNIRFAQLCITEDAQEGVNAFLNKRKPIWKNK